MRELQNSLLCSNAMILTLIESFSGPHNLLGLRGHEKNSISVKRASLTLNGVLQFPQMSDDFAMVYRYPREPLRILLSGSSGFIGSALKSFLDLAGHQVVRLVRNRNDCNKDAIFWDPSSGELQKEDFERFDAVIHLAGAGIADRRWTKERKESLFLSRCRDTWLLSQILCRLYSPPHTLICASAIGYYGDRPGELLTEESSQGEGYLATLCQQWEKATEAIENRGTRVIHARFGAVLGAQGGILKKMIPIFRAGLGGRLGSGKQMMSWIGINDLLGGIYHCLMTKALCGPVNFTSPEQVTQAEFAQMLAHKLHRSAWLHLPAFLLKWVFGQMGKELFLFSQKVIPQKLMETGYVFRCPSLGAAFDDLDFEN